MSKKAKSRKAYLAPGEVAELLMVSPQAVRVWAKKGELQSVSTPGGHRRFARHEVERFAREKDLTIQLPTDDALRILIVDDDVAMADYLSEFLRSVDASVTTMIANDGYAAGELVQVFQPHVVLLDLIMPGLDGFDVCVRIRNNPATKATRVITMTGFHDDVNVDRSLQAGAECCIKKPVDHDQLLTLLGLGEGLRSAADRVAPPV